MKIKFSFLVALAAALVAGCAAYYSVFGLSQLFAGASTAVIIMASSLEFSKIIAVSFLHRYWNRISTSLKIYLTIGVFILICVTSSGIYGFLSNAYQKTANKLEISNGQLSVLDSKKSMFQSNIDANQRNIDLKTTRIQQLTGLRTTQESRLDAATTNSARIRSRNDISASNSEIQKLSGEIDVLNQKNSSLLDSVNFYSGKSIESKSNDVTTGELGPLKYLAQLTGYPMDKVVNWFILLLIFVFDPLAVSLVVATNRVLELEKNNGSEVNKPSVEPKPKKENKIFKPLIETIKNHSNGILNKINKIFKKKVTENPIEVTIETPIQKPEIVETPVVDIIEPKVELPVEIPVIEVPVVETPQETVPSTNRGFSVNIPDSNNIIERIGSNKVVKNTEPGKVFFKRRG